MKHIKRIVLVLSFIATSGWAIAQDITGNWYSKARIDGEEQHFLFQIQKQNTDYKGLVDFLTERAYRIRLDTVGFAEGNVLLAHAGKGLRFTGTFDSTSQSLRGIVQYGEAIDTISISREPQARRTQTIQEPVPYISQDVYFYNQDSTKLAGTITYPKKGKNLKAVVLVTGSGAQNRDEEILGHKPFLILADYLSRRGIVVLRYDDRGYGESEGEFRPATTMDYAHDALAAVQYLKEFKGVSIGKIGVAGHSEGGNIAPVVATMEPAVDFLVLLAAPGTSNVDFMIQSADLLFKEEYPDMYDSHVPFYQTVYRDMATISDKEVLADSLGMKFRRFAEQMGESEYGDYGTIDDYVASQVEGHTDVWWHYFLQFDVTDYLSQLHIPVLALNGDRDTDVEAKSNLNGIRQTLQKAGNENVKIVELENVNHFFQVSETNKIEDVYFNEETFSIIALEEIYKWVSGL